MLGDVRSNTALEALRPNAAVETEVALQAWPPLRGAAWVGTHSRTESATAFAGLLFGATQFTSLSRKKTPCLRILHASHGGMPTPAASKRPMKLKSTITIFSTRDELDTANGTKTRKMTAWGPPSQTASRGMKCSGGPPSPAPCGEAHSAAGRSQHAEDGFPALQCRPSRRGSKNNVELLHEFGLHLLLSAPQRP